LTTFDRRKKTLFKFPENEKSLDITEFFSNIKAFRVLAAGEGFEPSHTESEAGTVRPKAIEI
jgi:hypothetical protein